MDGGGASDNDFIKADAGKIILQDGTLLEPKEFNYDTYDIDNPPVAVVAFERDGKLYGIGLQTEAKLEWAVKKTTGENMRFSKTVCRPKVHKVMLEPEANTYTGDIDGSDNWAEICAADPEGSKYVSNYPIFNFAETYGKVHSYSGELETGWYIPSIAELSNVIRNVFEINRGFKAIYKIDKKLGIDGISLGCCYWSSSQDAQDAEDAWIIVARSGFLNNATKKSLRTKDLQVFVLHEFYKPADDIEE